MDADHEGAPSYASSAPHSTTAHGFQRQYSKGSTHGCALNLTNIGLDQGRRLENFAAKNNAETFKVWAADDPSAWRFKFLELMSEKDTKLFVNMDGLETPLTKAIDRAARNRGGGTDWELLQIWKNKEWWDRITWIENGVETSNPFAK